MSSVQELFPTWFFEIYQKYLTTIPINCTENLEKILERIAVDGFGEMYLKEIRRTFKNLTSNKGRPSYDIWLRWHYILKGEKK